MSKKVTSFRLSVEALEQLKKLAEKNNRSMANMIEELIRKEFEKNQLTHAI